MRSSPDARSAGVVLTRIAEPGPQYLVLRAYRYWDFPKGEIEPREDPLACALREAAEETGLHDLTMPWGPVWRETPPYGSRRKIARYYVAQTASTAPIELPVNPALGRPEHHEYRWLPRAAATALLVPRVREILEWAADVIGDRGGSDSFARRHEAPA